jgi:hypothetical protein
MSRPTIPTERIKQQREIEIQTREFLARGGKIQNPSRELDFDVLREKLKINPKNTEKWNSPK